MSDYADHKFKCITADPPWPYEGGGPVGTGGRGAEFVRAMPSPSSNQRYGSMSIGELSDMNIAALSENNAHLYLWTTDAFMYEAHDVARAWGFAPKRIITWAKEKADGTPSMKTGYYYRGATEHVLFCVRGSLRLQGPPHGTWFKTPRLPHSIKPDYFYQMVQEQSPGPYLELFARQCREGWSVWGNEVLSDVCLCQKGCVCGARARTTETV